MSTDLIEADAGDFAPLRSRKIDAETVKKFGYRVVSVNNKTVQVAPYYTAEGQLVAQKVRAADKTFKWLGDPKDALPFGSQCWQKTGKMIVVTEGEIDAMAMSKCQDNKWPVVSIACGAGAQVKKYMAKHRNYFIGFDKVIIMFDSDDKGRESAKVAAAVIGSKAHIAELPLKDAGEMLVAGRVKDLLDAMWRAPQYHPEGLVDMASLKAAVLEKPKWGLSWPFKRLTEATYGLRTGELIAVGAGTGSGKSDFLTQCIAHLVTEHKQPVGVFALEQSPRETATRIAGKLAGKTFHLPDSGWQDSDKEKAWTTLMRGGKVHLYDSFGINEWETIEAKIEYLAHSEDVKFFFLDHLTALAAAVEDERKALEVIMAEMASLVKRLDITIVFVSHLATPDGKSHEEGGRVMLKHLKGSRSIAFWCTFALGLERDQQATNEVERHTSILRILKDRLSGQATGRTFNLAYDPKTGLLSESVADDFGFQNEVGKEEEEF